LPLLEWAARHDLEQNSLFGSRIIEHLDDDRFSFAEARQQSQIVINVRPLHGQQIPGVPGKVFDPRCRVECVGGRNKSMHLNGLDQFAFRRDLGVGFLAFKHPIQKPNDETVRQQYQGADQTRPMPEMPELNWN